MNDIPYLIAINLTERCNLNCAHCYMDAQRRISAQNNELNHAELSTLFQTIAKRAPGTIIVLTGGEPLLRPDIDNLVKSGVKAELRVVIGTNGHLLNKDKIVSLKKIGLSGVGISMDSVHADQHDSFRGVPGSFEKAVKAIKLCRPNDLHVQIHFTVTQSNHKQIEPAVHMAKELGASIINFFFLVCIGRGQSSMDLSPMLYESCLNQIAGLQDHHKGIMIQSRCTPHFKRILYERNPESPYTRATGYDGGGCPAARRYCRIDPQGEVTPCPYMTLSAGNIRQKSFWEIWDNATLFNSLRNPDFLLGRCGKCEYKLLCGGCRARSLVQSGNVMEEDPNCLYKPYDGEVIPIMNDPITPSNKNIIWTDEAKERLNKIPIFLRGRIRKKLEERAKTEGIPVTKELMQKHRSEREKELGIKLGNE